MRFYVRRWSFGILFAGIFAGVAATHAATNYDENLVGTYELPDPLKTQDGKAVVDAETWTKKRRPEILELYHTHIHGRSPERPRDLAFDVFETDPKALGGKAVRKQVTISFSAKSDAPKMHLLVYLPAEQTKPVPVFLCLHFNGNHRITAEPAIKMNEEWDRKAMTKKMPAETTRGASKAWPIEKILSRGYGIATINYCDIEPDFPGGWTHGVRQLLLKEGQTEPAPDEWGAIGAWAWGMSRALDYLETDRDVDAKRVVALGQSRLGKTVLWAGANDPRFAMVIASCSGEMGAALGRRNYGENIDNMVQKYSYQFCGNFRKFEGKWNEMPVDSHMLISLVAPRPLLLSTGSEDQWSDPKGEFLAAVAAEPVYRLLGREGLGTSEMPPNDTPMLKPLGFQCHTGKHEITLSDWDRFLEFADLYLR